MSKPMIYTFYSFKGGVGRSMALVNIAEILYRARLKTIIIDWDLEAPGLERFYPDKAEEILESPGIIDMLIAYKSKASRLKPDEKILFSEDEIKKYLIDIYGDEYLWLIPAGYRAKEGFVEYANRVKTFDWKDFYENWEGEIYFEWLRGQFEQFANVVLIDSRTGVNEMGGVCTYQFADVVVMFCAPNKQNMDGTYELARSFKRSQIKKARYGRPMETLIVPARVEDRAEIEILNEFHGDFVAKFNKFVPKVLGENAESFWKLKIPYVPYYAFKELVSVREIGKVGSEDLIRAYYSLAEAMARFDPSLKKAIQSRYDEVFARKESINRISVILPAFNEEATIGGVILSASRYADLVVVIDDGSSDRTAEIAEQMAETANVEVIRHPLNRGRGAALKTGFDAIRGAEVIVTMDSDGQHDPADIPNLIEPILRGEADMVNGSRYLRGDKKETPYYRRIGQKVLDKAINLESGLDITDSQNSFRAFSAGIMNIFRFTQDGYAIESEMLADAANAGLRIKEVPISVRPIVYASTENPISHGVAVLINILQDMELNRPLYYFTVPGIVMASFGIVVGLLLLQEFYSGHVLQFGPTLLMILLTLIGSFMMFTGMIMHSISNLVNKIQKKSKN